MGLSKKQVDEAMRALRQPDVIQKNGGFLLLYAHSRWHLMTTMYMNPPGKRDWISTVHFMDDAGARRYLKDFIDPPVIQTVDQMFIGFQEEFAAKVLPTAEAYLPLLEDGMLEAMTGFTTDTTSVGKIGARGVEFVKGLQKVMDREVVGFALKFTRPATTGVS